MENLTLSQILTTFALVLSAAATFGGVVSLGKKWTLSAVSPELEKIQSDIEAIKKSSRATSQEVKLIANMQNAIREDLLTHGHVNGRTEKASEELQHFLIENQ